MEGTLVKNKIDWIAEILFYIALSIEIVIVVLDKSDYIIQFQSYWFRLTFVLFGLKILLTKYSIRELCTIILFGFIGAISYKVTGRNEIIRIVVFVAAFKKLNVKRVLKYTFYLTGIGCVLLMCFSLIGIGTLKQLGEWRGYPETRYCFGMGHPNAAHCMFWSLIILFIYVYEKKLNYSIFFILLAVNQVLFLFTDSRIGMGITVLTLILAIVLRKMNSIRNGKAIILLGIIVVVTCFVVSALFSCYNLYESILKPLDEFLTGRIICTIENTNMRFANWTMFGLPENKLYADLGIVRIAYWYGIIPMLLYLFMCCKLIWFSRKSGDYMAAVLAVVITIYTVVEAHTISVFIARNYLLFLFGAYWNKMLCSGVTEERYLWKYLYKNDGNALQQLK